MPKPSEPPGDWDQERAGIIGLGEHSLRKSHYPELQARLRDLEAANEKLRREIDQRQKAEHALRLTQFAVDRNQTPMFCLAMDGRLIYANDAACRHLGRTRAELEALRVPDIDPDWPAEVWENRIDRLRQTGGETFESRHRRKDGSVVPVEITADIVDSGDGAVVFAFATDISERKQAEQELQQRMREMSAVNWLGRQVSARLPLEEVIGASLDGLTSAVGPDLAVLFRCESKELVLEGFRRSEQIEWSDDGVAHRVGECLCGLAASERAPLYSSDITTDSRCTLSECRHAGLRSFAALPLRSGEELMGVLGLASRESRDFASQGPFLETLAATVAMGLHNALLFEQVRRHSRELEERVAQRTAELQSANQELEAFSYTVSHDLRAPVRHIGGFARILADEHGAPLSAEGRRLLGIVQTSAHKMGTLIDDLLTLSHLGRQPLERGRVDCEKLVREVWDELAAPRAAHAVRLEVGALAPARADAGLLRQVWLNLLDNAIKYSSTRTQPEITVDSVTIGQSVWYRVRDNGVGFDPQYQGKLFGVFQRLHSQADFAGTGVGLAIVQRIIHRHGGTVRAHGDVDQGATFEFCLES